MRPTESDGSEVTLRPAVTDDVRFVWEVNNERAVRLESVRTEPIPWHDHVMWYTAQLASQSCLFLIAERGGAPVGVLRFERSVDGCEALVSIALAPAARGRGLGTPLLTEGGRRALAALGVRRIAAWIRPTNAASLRAFARAGYREAGEGTQDGVRLVRLLLSPTAD
jgi:RimJ/RimL family protein N-acetyltransferase